MTTLFDSRRSVKHARPFAFGLTRQRAERRAPFTAADLTWAAANLNQNTRQYEVAEPSDADYDFAAACALAQARLDAGFPLF